MGAMRRSRLAATGAGAALVALAGSAAPLALAGASGGPTAPEVLATAVKDLAGATNLTLAGVVVNGSAKISFSFEGADHGSSAAGKMTEGRESFQFVRVASKLYLRANAAFWAANSGGLPKAEVAALVPRWIIMPSSAAKSFDSAFGSFTDPTKLTTGLFGKSTANVRFGKTTTLGGVRVQALVDPKSAMTAYVTLGAPLRPLEVRGGKKGNSGQVRFGYPALLTIAAPAGAETLQKVLAAAAKG